MSGEVTQKELNHIVNNITNNLISTADNLQSNQMGLQEQIINLDHKKIDKNNLSLSEINLSKTYNQNITNLYSDGQLKNVQQEVTFDSKIVNENFILGNAVSIIINPEQPFISEKTGNVVSKQLFNLYLLNNQINLQLIDTDDDSVYRLIWNNNLKQFEGPTEEVKENSHEVLVGWVVLK